MASRLLIDAHVNARPVAGRASMVPVIKRNQTVKAS